MDSTGKIVDPNVRVKLREKYLLMFGRLEFLETGMRPVSKYPLKKGALILFEADMLHRGDDSTDNKTVLFFHTRRHVGGISQQVEEDLQFHVALLGSIIYGNIPRYQEEKNEYFQMIKRHDESIPITTVRLTDLMDENVRRCYQTLFSTQPRSFNV